MNGWSVWGLYGQNFQSQRLEPSDWVTVHGHCSWALLKKKEYKNDPRDLGRHKVQFDSHQIKSNLIRQYVVDMKS